MFCQLAGPAWSKNLKICVQKYTKQFETACRHKVQNYNIKLNCIRVERYDVCFAVHTITNDCFRGGGTVLKVGEQIF